MQVFPISFQVEDSATQLSNAIFNNDYVQSQRRNSHIKRPAFMWLKIWALAFITELPLFANPSHLTGRGAFFWISAPSLNWAAACSEPYQITVHIKAC